MHDMWTLLFIIAAAALWYSPSLRRSLARVIDPDQQPGRGPQAGSSTTVQPDPAAEPPSAEADLSRE